MEKQKRLENSAEYDNVVLGEADTDVLMHRRTGENNRQIISKATYHKLINPVVQKGGMIITASDDNKWMDYLDRRGATAVTLEDVIIFRPDATTTEVLEEVYHFNQNRASLNNQYPSQQRMVLNEIDAQEYLIRVADKYKIPQSEREETKALLELYRNQMEDMKKAGEWID